MKLRVVGAVILDGPKVLLAQRSSGVHEGLWEFPGGKVEQGETDAQALERELLEELGVCSKTLELVAVGHDSVVQLWCYESQLQGTPQALEHHALAWFELREIQAASMPPADHPALQALLTRAKQG